ncbi:actin-binding LIM protein 2-like isoform X3 [Amphiura filiformis]|uniref:actin-binding LIM protein 2-like isoform X3 n=1 Tax=Amphiura filiformis TaxID=82378 RepID=UPI003B213C23
MPTFAVNKINQGKKSSEKNKKKNAVTAETSTSNGTTTDKKASVSDKKTVLPNKNAVAQDTKPITMPTNVTAGTKVITPSTSAKATTATNGDRRKVACAGCNKICSGEVLRVQNEYFHVKCFRCCICAVGLAQGGFFTKNGKYYCAVDYQEQFGTKCRACGEYLEGEVVTALGDTYHKFCFVCARCGHSFEAGEEVSFAPDINCCFCLLCHFECSICSVTISPGEKVTYNGRDVLCPDCTPLIENGVNGPVDSNIADNNKVWPLLNSIPEKPKQAMPPTVKCANCEKDINESQALIALDKHWHMDCFRCLSCKVQLAGEYMGRDGKPYCEKDYQRLFGVRCSQCEQFITGKVLEAGDKRYHPSCAKCGRCGNHFAEGEDMYIQGTEIWHPDCTKSKALFLDFTPLKLKENALLYDYNRNRMTPSERSRSLSPDSSCRFQSPTMSPTRSSNSLYNQVQDQIQSYLSPTHDIKNLYPRPLQLSPEPPVIPNYHRPEFVNKDQEFSYKSPPRITPQKVKKWSAGRSRSGGRRSGFETLQPKPKPMKDEALSLDVIKQSRLPAAKKPPPGAPAKVEREDWPGPPFPPLIDRHRSKSLGDLDEEQREEREVQRRIDDEVNRMPSFLGKEIIKTELEKRRLENIDPRSASRTPAADHEPPIRTRYESSVNALPLRERQRHYYTPLHLIRAATSAPRSSTLPNTMRYTSVMDAYKKSSSLPQNARDLISPSWYSDASDGSYLSNGYTGYTNSMDFSSPKSIGSLSEHELRMLRIIRGRSLPNVGHKIYPIETLLTTNYRLPKDVDRECLELHLSAEDFFRAFGMDYEQFTSLPSWKRADLKKEALLF